MIEPIEQLAAGDCDELVSFLNRAFGVAEDLGFATFLSGLYQPADEKMARHLVVRRDGRMAAALGLYPIHWRVGGDVLPLGGIGGVSVAPEHRGSGLMKRLMQAAIDQMQRDGTALSYLGGRRQRYRYFGWEVAGCDVEFSFNGDNFRHAFGDAPQRLAVRACTKDDAATLQRLHDQQAVHCVRPTDDFMRFLHHWRARPLALVDTTRKVVGYAVVHRTEPRVLELVMNDAEWAAEAMRALASYCHRGDLRIAAPPFQQELIRSLVGVAERCVVQPGGNWRIFDWPRTLTALLRAKRRMGPLTPGEATLTVDGQALTLRVTPDDAVCEPLTATADLSLTGMQATRLLFGPLPPAQAMTLPDDATMLAAWCPLPLGIPRQDHV